ncbi:MAG: hypothetical protein Q7J34_14180 [Bacteroidales bacterium]|nr:hypothetical protein [Bacteroidales bacterium]
METDVHSKILANELIPIIAYGKYWVISKVENERYLELRKKYEKQSLIPEEYKLEATEVQMNNERIFHSLITNVQNVCIQDIDFNLWGKKG